MVRNTAGNELRAWMKRMGRGYPDLAKALDISRPHLVHLVTGGRTPSLALAGRIAAVTGIPESVWRRVA